MRKLDRRPRTKPPGDRWFIYLLRRADDSLYRGIAKDVNRRCGQHNGGTASRYTRCRSVAPPYCTRKGIPAGMRQ